VVPDRRVALPLVEKDRPGRPVDDARLGRDDLALHRIVESEYGLGATNRGGRLADATRAVDRKRRQFR
jgi:hypothetical protein